MIRRNDGIVLDIVCYCFYSRGVRGEDSDLGSYVYTCTGVALQELESGITSPDPTVDAGYSRRSTIRFTRDGSPVYTEPRQEDRMTYSFKTRPYSHQREALERAQGRQGYALLMEMGTGKTKVALDEAGILHDSGEIDSLVVLAPKGVYRNWERTEIPTHLGCRHVTHVWLPSGGGQKNKKHLELALSENWDPSVLRILLMNVEALGAGTRASDYLQRFIESSQRGVYIAVDESTTIKNPDAKRTKKIVRFGQMAKYRRIMTGSPVTRSPLDLHSQFAFLGPGLIGPSSYYAFRARHAVMERKVFGGRSVNIVVGYRNLDELGQRLDEHSFRKTKEECLDLPEKVYSRHEVELTEEQQRVYSAVRSDAFSLLGETTVSASSAITLILRLHQIVCGHVTDDDGDVQSLKNNRISELISILQETSGDVVIWARYQHDIREICRTITEEFGEESLAQFHGGNSATRHLDEDRFKNDDSCRFMVSSDAGARGNTWINARLNIYYSNSYDLEVRMQSEDRTHRSGQRGSVQYIDMVCPGTVDEKIIEALRSKRNIADRIVDKVEILREWI